MTAIIIDTETTGLIEPRLVEAALVAIASPQNLIATQDFNARFNPGKPIEFGAMAVHHITDADVAACAEPHTFTLPDDTEYIIGHNVDFDWKVIGEPNVKRICTLAFCRKLWPETDSHTLGAMLLKLEGQVAVATLLRAHSAIADAYMCRTILEHILQKIGHSSITWEDVWKQSEAARVPDVMTFGKHKGTRIADVPSDYKRWLLGQPDVDPYLAKALRAT